MRYAVFDLGSNSVKFIAAERHGNHLRILRELSISTRLAEHLIDTAELRPQAIARTLTALRQLRAEADALGVRHFRAVATSAVRDSRNRREFLKAAREVLGFPVRLLSGTEEAETIFSGVMADVHWRGKDLFILDIGGGSVEWVQGGHGKLEKRLSLPLGAVRLRERFLHSYPVAADTAALLIETVRAQIAHPLASYELDERRLVGTGGTVTCLAAIYHGMAHFDPRKIDHTSLTLEQVRALMGSFTGRTLEQLSAIPGLPSKRIDLIIPGTAVVLATMELLGARRLSISVRGLRYGVLTAVIRDGALFAGHFSAKKMNTLLHETQALRARYDEEPSHSDQVALLALQIFDALRGWHDLGERPRELLHGAALLHDIGWSQTPDGRGHHKWSAHLIQKHAWKGLQPEEVEIVAQVARYHRKALPGPNHEDFHSLSSDAQRLVMILGGILRVADALDRTHTGRVKKVTVRITRDQLEFGILAKGDWEAERTMFETKREMLEQAAGRVALCEAVDSID